MKLDATSFERITHAVLGDDSAISADDAHAVIGIARLAAAADRDDDADERAMCDAIVAQVAAAGGIAVPTSPGTLTDPRDPEARAAALSMYADSLEGRPIGDLAYALAYVVIVSDVELAPEESELLEELQDALGLAEDRAEQVTAIATELLTPE